MVIKIKVPEPEQSAHDEAAAAIETTIAQTTTKSGVEEPLSQTVEHFSEPAPELAAGPHERIEVGMSFKMPVASYTMLEFSIRRSVPFYTGGAPDADEIADAVFTATKDWVEAKLNALVEAQQSSAAG